MYLTEEASSSQLLLPPAIFPGIPIRREPFEKLKSDLPGSVKLLSENCLVGLSRCMVIELEVLFCLKRFELDLFLGKTIPVLLNEA